SGSTTDPASVTPSGCADRRPPNSRIMESGRASRLIIAGPRLRKLNVSREISGGEIERCNSFVKSTSHLRSSAVHLSLRGGQTPVLCKTLMSGLLSRIVRHDTRGGGGRDVAGQIRG